MIFFLFFCRSCFPERQPQTISKNKSCTDINRSPRLESSRHFVSYLRVLVQFFHSYSRISLRPQTGLNALPPGRIGIGRCVASDQMPASSGVAQNSFQPLTDYA